MICGTTPLTFSIIALPMTMTEVGHPHPFFAGRVAVIATMHRKQEAIAPLVEAHLGACAFPVALSNRQIQRARTVDDGQSQAVLLPPGR